MFERILVPLDGSELGEGVLSIVTQIAMGAQSKVTLLHVTREGVPSGTDAEKTVERYLVKGAKRLALDGISVETRLMAGYPAIEIARIAQEEGFGLIAMATHGQTGLGRWAYGSTTDKVLHSTVVPLLLRRPRGNGGDGHGALQSLVVPLDESAFSESILPWAEGVAAALRLPVHLIEILPGQLAPTAAFTGYAFDPSVRDDAVAQANSYLETVAGRLKKKDIRVTWKALLGHPPSKIIDYAGQTPGRLIVMATHGRSGPGRWVLGSVADRVLRASNQPVLVVRPTNGETPIEISPDVETKKGE